MSDKYHDRLDERERVADILRSVLDGLETAIGRLGERRGLCEAWDRVAGELASVTENREVIAPKKEGRL